MALRELERIYEELTDGTPRELVGVSKLHSLGWKHQIEINEGVNRLFQGYRSTLA